MSFIFGLMKRQPMVVFDLLAAAECAVGLAHHIGRGHGLDAAGDGQLQFAAGDGAESGAHRVHTRGAETVERHARNRLRQPGKQRGHACDIAVVLAGLVGATHEDFIDRRRVKTGLRSSNALSGIAARSSARTPASTPPKRPMGVLRHRR